MRRGTSAAIAFACPVAVERLSVTLADAGADEGLGGETDADGIASFLARRAGLALLVEIPGDEPDASLRAVADALDEAGAPYVGVHDGITPGAGPRRSGRVLLNAGGGRMGRLTVALPWQAGPPWIDAPTLASAGLSDAGARAILGRVLPRPCAGGTDGAPK